MIQYLPRIIAPPIANQRFGHDEFTTYYYAQAMYGLGEDGYAKLFPKAAPADIQRWSTYRQDLFDRLQKTQNADGSWAGGGGFSVGTVSTPPP